jgi:hypothetical protein
MKTLTAAVVLLAACQIVATAGPAHGETPPAAAAFSPLRSRKRAG